MQHTETSLKKFTMNILKEESRPLQIIQQLILDPLKTIDQRSVDSKPLQRTESPVERPMTLKQHQESLNQAMNVLPSEIICNYQLPLENSSQNSFQPLNISPQAHSMPNKNLKIMTDDLNDAKRVHESNCDNLTNPTELDDAKQTKLEILDPSNDKFIIKNIASIPEEDFMSFPAGLAAIEDTRGDFEDAIDNFGIIDMDEGIMMREKHPQNDKSHSSNEPKEILEEIEKRMSLIKNLKIVKVTEGAQMSLNETVKQTKITEAMSESPPPFLLENKSIVITKIIQPSYENVRKF
jgi:hypothetical protein